MSRRLNIMNLPVEDIASSIKSGNRVMLGRAITLVESKNPKHQAKGDALLSYLLKKPSSSFRIAISGAPGVGKSTFIEKMGMKLINEGYSIAVLSIDPSSDINRGSILGDKTRMERLSVHPEAFIRPSPAGNFLGGIAWRTREAMTICEAAGYDIVIIETVGVGQSEFKVKEMVDCFFLLLSPGGGDELQGIKKGIVEIADIISINKSDGSLEETAHNTRKEYSQALQLLPPKASNWTTRVINSSCIKEEGIIDALELIHHYKNHIEDSGYLGKNRIEQKIEWFKERVTIGLQQYVQSQSKNGIMQNYIHSLKENKKDPIQAANAMVNEILH